MKRPLSVSLPLIFLLCLLVITFFNGTGRAQTPPPHAQAQTAVTPNASGSVAAQTGDEAEARRRAAARPGRRLKTFLNKAKGWGDNPAAKPLSLHP